MELAELSDLIRAAKGERLSDLILKNARIVNVFTGEIEGPTQLAIIRSRIAGWGDGYRGLEVIDLEGRYVAPGFIDAHVHIESSMCTPPEFAKAVLVHGVTTVITDPHEIANVLGFEGIRYMLEAAKYNPMTMYVMAPSCVPATEMATAGAHLEASDLEPLMSSPWVLGLAEMMNYPGVLNSDIRTLEKILLYHQTPIDGHSPGLTGQALMGYLSAGVRSDHECITAEEVEERLRLGVTVFLREATNAKNLVELLPAITPANAAHACFCTDDRHPADLIDEGSVDHAVRIAIENGIDPVTALKMASFNVAQHFALWDQGAIAPGRRADLIIFKDLKDIQIETVIRGGKVVVRDGEFVAHPEGKRREMHLRSSMNVPWDQIDLNIPVGGTKVHVIGMIPDQLVTENLILEPKIVGDYAVTDVSRDLLKIAVIERHRASGNVGKGFIQGFGLKRGAIAGTVAHDHHNLIVVGADDQSMMTAARELGRLGGGLAAALGDRVLGVLPLPVAGLMSDRPVEEVRADMDALLKVTHDLGSPMHDPYMAMGFMGLEVIPKLKLTDLGLVDVEQFKLIDLWVE